MFRKLSVYIFLILYVGCSTPDYSPIEIEAGELCYTVVSQQKIYDDGKHAAFTALESLDNHLICAFRSAPNHNPISDDEYGVIKIIESTSGGGIFSESFILAASGKDLRDPFLVNIGGKLRLYCGYNIVKNGQYQHMGTLYSDRQNNGRWTPLKTVIHDCPHVLWLWKIRKHGAHYYSVGYLEGEKPVLLCSEDGIEWDTVSELNINGIFSEADMAFSSDTMYICLRRDEPRGANSIWGKSVYPFVDFQLKEMNASIACPEIYYNKCSSHFLIAGREYVKRTDGKIDSLNLSLFSVNHRGDARRILLLDGTKDGDKGYPSFYDAGDIIYMTWYDGVHPNTAIYMTTIKISGSK